jgi:uncharacterized protein YhbP (UPF0306 family)
MTGRPAPRRGVLQVDIGDKPMKPPPLPPAALDSLLSKERVLVLASSREGRPWCASVYFAHRGGRFYFFSSPDSRHIQEFRLHPEAAAAVSADHSEWQQIQGFQMQGRVAPVQGTLEKFIALKLYLKKFPFVKSFIREHGPDTAARWKTSLAQEKKG